MEIEKINLYISAASDLYPERDLVSRVVTELPVTFGWKINLSPLGRKTFDERLVLDSDIHSLILGEDIRAPIGYEWYLSRKVGRKPIFFIKENIPRTMAAGDFLRNLSTYPRIVTYKTLAEFRVKILLHIGQSLLENADQYSIESKEYDTLSSFLNTLEETEPETLEIVTGEDSIILTRERFIPKDGVLIDPHGDVQNKNDASKS